MDAPAARHDGRFRRKAGALSACLFVLASGAVLNRRDSSATIPKPPPLYDRAGSLQPLEPGASRLCPSAILVAGGVTPFYSLTSVDDGVRFDIDGDGRREAVSWTQANTAIAFLAIDRDGNGAITSGKELFGSYTWPGMPHGFEALTAMNFDSNGGIDRGAVTSDDPLFAKLLLWTDANHNAVSEPSELQRADGVYSAIGLGYGRERGRDPFGNRFLYEGWVHIRTAPGRNQSTSALDDMRRSRRIYNVCFVQD